MKLPLSIVITTYNRENELRRCIESVLEQNYEDYELIIVDDHSTPSYKEQIIRDFPEVKYFYQEVNLGPGISRNLGIQEAEHNFVVIMDDDDIFVPNAFDKISNFLLKNNDLSDPVVHFLCSTTTLKKDIEFQNYNFKEYLQGVVSGDTTHVINKKVFIDQYNYNFPDSRIGAELLLWYQIVVNHGYLIVNDTVVEVCEDATNRLTNTSWQITKASLFAEYQIELIEKFGIEIIRVGNLPHLLNRYRGAITYSLLAGNRQLAWQYLRRSFKYSKKQLAFLPLFIIPKKMIINLFIRYRK